MLAKIKNNWFEDLLNGYRLLTIKKYAKELQTHIDFFEPDIIHAMRIPYEGIIASHCDTKKPIILSIWGNDLTLHASNGGRKAQQILRSIRLASAIHVDAQRDINLLWSEYDFNQNSPYLVIPASGGIDTKNLRLDISKQQAKKELGFNPNSILVCNPRGLRPYIDTKVFIAACEEVVRKTENVIFILVGVDNSLADWGYSKDARNIGKRLISTGSLDIDRFRLLLRAIDIFVSPSTHDGMPISLLEGMGSGVFPILSNIDSVTGFVRHKNQGRIFELGNPSVLGDEIIDVIENVNFVKASIENETLAYDEYSVDNFRLKIECFYEDVYNH